MANIFSIEGSLIDLNAQSVPNFHRSSPVMLERIVDGSLQLYPIETYHPAFSSETSAFLIEPATANLVTHNMDLSDDAIWLKGSNVEVRKDYAGQGEVAPDGTPTSDRLRWDTGVGESQIMRRTFFLDAETEYTLSWIFRLRGGLFGVLDCLRLVGEVSGTVQTGLDGLNATPNRYVLNQLTFKTAGRKPIFPGNIHQISTYQVTAVTANSVTVSIPSGFVVAAQDWVGGLLEINKLTYLIIQNTALSNGTIVVTVNTSTLISNGVVAGVKAALAQAPKQAVTLELYCESTVSIDWGGMQLEKLPFRTSMIYQQKQIETRSAALLSWRHSPIAGMKTFGFFAVLDFWRGDGNLFSFGNLTGTITNGKLVIKAEITEVALVDSLPTSNLRIFLQIQEATSSLSIYVNGVLKARTIVNNFRGATDKPLFLTSGGVRCWQRLIVKDEALLEGQISVGETAKQDVLSLFNNLTPIDAVAISAHAALITLPPITVPPKPAPVASMIIRSVTYGTGVVTVDTAINFVVGAPVVVYRGEYVILRTYITNVNTAANQVTLSNAIGANIGDTLSYGELETPGTASIRFPWDAIDPQIIKAIDNIGPVYSVTVDSTLSFTKSRAFVRNDLYQEVAEVIITYIDHSQQKLELNSVQNLSVGGTIAQPLNELKIEPDNYFVVIVDPEPGVSCNSQNGKWNNATVIENNTKEAKTVTVGLRIYL